MILRVKILSITTDSIMKLRNWTVAITTLGITTLGIITLSITTTIIKTRSIMTLIRRL